MTEHCSHKFKAGDLVRSKINRSAKVRRGSLGMITRGISGEAYWIVWRNAQAPEAWFARGFNIKPANPDTMSKAERLWAVKMRLKGALGDD